MYYVLYLEFGVRLLVDGLVGLDVDALGYSPRVLLVGIGEAGDLQLAADRSAVLIARQVQVHVCLLVLEAHGGVAAPQLAVALDRPVVALVALAVLAVGAHLLVVGQRRLEVMAVQVALGRQVKQTHRIAALDRLTMCVCVFRFEKFNTR